MNNIDTESKVRIHIPPHYPNYHIPLLLHFHVPLFFLLPLGESSWLLISSCSKQEQRTIRSSSWWVEWESVQDQLSESEQEWRFCINPMKNFSGPLSTYRYLCFSHGQPVATLMWATNRQVDMVRGRTDFIKLTNQLAQTHNQPPYPYFFSQLPNSMAPRLRQYWMKVDVCDECIQKRWRI